MKWIACRSNTSKSSRLNSNKETRSRIVVTDRDRRGREKKSKLHPSDVFIPFSSSLPRIYVEWLSRTGDGLIVWNARSKAKLETKAKRRNPNKRREARRSRKTGDFYAGFSRFTLREAAAPRSRHVRKRESTYASLQTRNVQWRPRNWPHFGPRNWPHRMEPTSWNWLLYRVKSNSCNISTLLNWPVSVPIVGQLRGHYCIYRTNCKSQDNARLLTHAVRRRKRKRAKVALLSCILKKSQM